MSAERIKVAIRIRPFLPNEDPSNKAINLIPEDENTIILYKEPQIFQGTFNQIFSDNSTQKDVFKFIKPCLLNIQKGINCTLLAYGQTGTGKTYTMFGGDWSFNEESNYNNSNLKNENENKKEELLQNQIIIDKNNEYNGIVPNLIMELYNIFNNEINKENEEKNNENTDNIIVTCSYIQIYNEKIYDLLDFSSLDQLPNENNKKLSSLKLKTDKKIGLIIDGANELRAPSYKDVFDILESGEINRKIRQTNKNNMSSRSHTIFMINIEDNISNFKSKIKLCDLAGSERYNSPDVYKKEHINEMKNINKSLFTLGNVINALAQKKKYVPYKDSKLTRILEDSLKGNSSIYLIATISPNEKNIDETYHTLKFADRAHSIMVKITPNQVGINKGSDNNKKLEELYGYKKNKEIEKLKGELMGFKKLMVLKENKNNLQEQFLNLKKENNQLKNTLKKINNIDVYNNMIRENKKLKKELNDLKIDYFNLKNELLLNKKIINNNIVPLQQIKNSLSQGNIFLKKFDNNRYRSSSNNKRNKKQLKKIDKRKKNNIENMYQEISTDNINKINKMSRAELIEKFKFNKIQNKKLQLKHIASKIDILNPNFINRQNFLIKEELKGNIKILSSLKRLQLLDNLSETRNENIKKNK